MGRFRSDDIIVDWDYFTWLYSMIGTVTNRNPATSHWMLAEQLHRTAFVWFIPNDDNRAADGAALRDEYIDLYGTAPSSGPCSMLEFLIAISRRVEFEAGEMADHNTVGDWFWRLVENLGLKQYTDERFIDIDATEDVDVVLIKFNNRQYQPDGIGGLFPLKQPEHDQREVELRYQMAAYLLENTDYGLD